MRRKVVDGTNGNGTGSAHGGFNGSTTAARNSSNNDMFGQAMGSMSDLGDLIELDATPDEVSRQLHEEITPRGTPVIGVDGSSSRSHRMGTAGVVGLGTDEEEEAMNERFPVRGRVRRAYVAD